VFSVVSMRPIMIVMMVADGLMLVMSDEFCSVAAGFPDVCFSHRYNGISELTAFIPI